MKRIALVARDNRRDDLLRWAEYKKDVLRNHFLYVTGTTGRSLQQRIGLGLKRMQRGPLGDDHQFEALVTAGAIDFLIFFWDPLEPQPHDPSVKALLRIAVVGNSSRKVHHGDERSLVRPDSQAPRPYSSSSVIGACATRAGCP